MLLKETMHLSRQTQQTLLKNEVNMANNGRKLNEAEEVLRRSNQATKRVDRFDFYANNLMEATKERGPINSSHGVCRKKK